MSNGKVIDISQRVGYAAPERRAELYYSSAPASATLKQAIDCLEDNMRYCRKLLKQGQLNTLDDRLAELKGYLKAIATRL